VKAGRRRGDGSSRSGGGGGGSCSSSLRAGSSRLELTAAARGRYRAVRRRSRAARLDAYSQRAGKETRVMAAAGSYREAVEALPWVSEVRRPARPAEELAVGGGVSGRTSSASSPEPTRTNIEGREPLRQPLPPICLVSEVKLEYGRTVSEGATRLLRLLLPL
jgi:hypothetical protein